MEGSRSASGLASRQDYGTFEDTLRRLNALELKLTEQVKIDITDLKRTWLLAKVDRVTRNAYKLFQVREQLKLSKGLFVEEEHILEEFNYVKQLLGDSNMDEDEFEAAKETCLFLGLKLKDLRTKQLRTYQENKDLEISVNAEIIALKFEDKDLTMLDLEEVRASTPVRSCGPTPLQRHRSRSREPSPFRMTPIRRMNLGLENNEELKKFRNVFEAKQTSDTTFTGNELTTSGSYNEGDEHVGPNNDYMFRSSSEVFKDLQDERNMSQFEVYNERPSSALSDMSINIQDDQDTYTRPASRQSAMGDVVSGGKYEDAQFMEEMDHKIEHSSEFNSEGFYSFNEVGDSQNQLENLEKDLNKNYNYNEMEEPMSAHMEFKQGLETSEAAYPEQSEEHMNLKPKKGSEKEGNKLKNSQKRTSEANEKKNEVPSKVSKKQEKNINDSSESSENVNMKNQATDNKITTSKNKDEISHEADKPVKDNKELLAFDAEQTENIKEPNLGHKQTNLSLPSTENTIEIKQENLPFNNSSQEVVQEEQKEIFESPIEMEIIIESDKKTTQSKTEKGTENKMNTSSEQETETNISKPQGKNIDNMQDQSTDMGDVTSTNKKGSVNKKVEMTVENFDILPGNKVEVQEGIIKTEETGQEYQKTKEGLSTNKAKMSEAMDQISNASQENNKDKKKKLKTPQKKELAVEKSELDKILTQIEKISDEVEVQSLDAVKLENTFLQTMASEKSSENSIPIENLNNFSKQINAPSTEKYSSLNNKSNLSNEEDKYKNTFELETEEIIANESQQLNNFEYNNETDLERTLSFEYESQELEIQKYLNNDTEDMDFNFCSQSDLMGKDIYLEKEDVLDNEILLKLDADIEPISTVKEIFTAIAKTASGSNIRLQTSIFDTEDKTIATSDKFEPSEPADYFSHSGFDNEDELMLVLESNDGAKSEDPTPIPECIYATVKPKKHRKSTSVSSVPELEAFNQSNFETNYGSYKHEEDFAFEESLSKMIGTQMEETSSLLNSSYAGNDYSFKYIKEIDHFTEDGFFINKDKEFDIEINSFEAEKMELEGENNEINSLHGNEEGYEYEVGSTAEDYTKCGKKVSFAEENIQVIIATDNQESGKSNLFKLKLFIDNNNKDKSSASTPALEASSAESSKKFMSAMTGGLLNEIPSPLVKKDQPGLSIFKNLLSPRKKTSRSGSKTNSRTSSLERRAQEGVADDADEGSILRTSSRESYADDDDAKSDSSFAKKFGMKKKKKVNTTDFDELFARGMAKSFEKETIENSQHHEDVIKASPSHQRYDEKGDRFTPFEVYSNEEAFKKAQQGEGIGYAEKVMSYLDAQASAVRQVTEGNIKNEPNIIIEEPKTYVRHALGKQNKANREYAKPEDIKLSPVPKRDLFTGEKISASPEPSTLKTGRSFTIRQEENRNAPVESVEKVKTLVGSGKETETTADVTMETQEKVEQESTYIMEELVKEIQSLPNQLKPDKLMNNEEFYEVIRNRLKTITEGNDALKDHQKYSHHLGRAEFGSLQRRRYNEDSSLDRTSNLNIYSSNEKFSDGMRAGEDAMSSVSREDSITGYRGRRYRRRQDEESSEVSDYAGELPDLEFEAIRPGSNRLDNSSVSNQQQQQQQQQQRSKLRVTQIEDSRPEVLLKKECVLRDIAEHKQQIKETKAWIQNSVMGALGFCVVVYLQSLEMMTAGQ